MGSREDIWKPCGPHYPRAKPRPARQRAPLVEGPSWLAADRDQWPKTDRIHPTSIDEKRTCFTFATKADPLPETDVEKMLARFSSATTVWQVFTHIFKCLPSTERREISARAPVLSAEELARTRRAVIRMVQRKHFEAETTNLLARHSLSKSSPLLRLAPFLDADGLLRVEGRLQNAFLSEDERHPIIIPNGSHLAELLIRDAHVRTLHGGPQLVMSFLLRAYWIVRARNRIRKLTRQCVICTRFRGKLQSQQMSPLPTARVAPARPFASTGLDYAGPFLLRTSKGRGYKAYKGYISLFVCLATRAIYVEVVSDYTTQTFLAAFRRFFSRRGLCRVVYSDNRTNFQGAGTELQRLFNRTSQFSREVADSIAGVEISWKFIPPRAPHFGGIWEAAVKSFKHHLRRVLADAKLTFEEFSTLAALIEACLNSRPLCPLSSNPEDLAALTLGHFLIGSVPTALPEPF